MLVMFYFVWSVALDTSWALSSVSKGNMSPLPAIFALENSQIHVYTSNSSDIASYIKAPINQTLSLAITLDIPYTQPNDCHIQFRQHFYDLRLQSKRYVVKNMVIFKMVLTTLELISILVFSIK